MASNIFPFTANLGNSFLSQIQQNWTHHVPLENIPFSSPQIGFGQPFVPIMNQMYSPIQFQQPLFQSAPQYEPNVLKYFQNYPGINHRAHGIRHNNTMIQIGIGNAQFGQQSPKCFQQHPLMSNKPLVQRPTSLSKTSEIKKSPILEAICVNQSQEIDKVFCDLQRIALNGCNIAEKVVQNHQKRPCFKKIDLLCGRLKQDLTNNNNVVANINSQGIAWAVKDFIFVFTRISSAWVILRGYIYNKSEGLDRIKSSIDPNLNKAFLDWQDVTRKLTDSLVKSFVTLDTLVLNQRSQKDKKDQQLEEFISPNYDDAFLVDLNRKLFDPDTIENSEETQRMHSANGTYFKSAVYEPLQKQSPNQSDKSNCDYALNDIFNDEFIEAEMEKVIGSPNKSCLVTSTPKSSPSNLDLTPQLFDFDKNPFNAKLRLVERFDLFGFNESLEPEPNVQFEKNPLLEPIEDGSGDSAKPFSPLVGMKLGDSQTLTKKFEEMKFEGTTNEYNSEMAEKVKILINKVLDLKETAYFISPTISRELFPKLGNLIPNDSSPNINLIIKNTQAGKGNTVNKVVADLRSMIDIAKTFAQTHGDAYPAWLQIISNYESGLLKILLAESYSSSSNSNENEE